MPESRRVDREIIRRCDWTGMSYGGGSLIENEELSVMLVNVHPPLTMSGTEPPKKPSYSSREAIAIIMMYFHHHPSYRSRDEKGPGVDEFLGFKSRNGVLSWLKIVGDKHLSDSPVSRIRTPGVRYSLGLVLHRIRINLLEGFRSTRRRVCRTIQVEIWIYFFEIGILCYRWG